ncbi:MAG: class I SAM-dependent methyltransferase [Bdellovibrionota bacterium]
MSKDLHPLSYPESSVKPVPQEAKSFKMNRDDIRSAELDFFIAERMAMELPEQKQIVENSIKAGLPEIQVSPYEGHVLSLLLQMMKAKRGVEIGTLGGYSTSWICRALERVEGARVDCLELSPKFAAVATENLKRWEGFFEIHVGPALKTLDTSLSDLKDLDFVFIDADKNNYLNYFEWAWPRIRKGGVILIDNFYLWGGVYFRGEDFPEAYAANIPGGILSKERWESMKALWSRLESLGSKASKTILSTSEGLGVVLKN